MVRLRLLTGLTCLLAVFFSCQTEEQGIKTVWNEYEYIFPFRYQIEEQKDVNRTWIRTTVDTALVMEGLSRTPPFYPIRLIAGASHFYILDSSEQVVHAYDYQGNLVRIIGGGMGRGPEEFQHVFDFAVAENEATYFTDLGKRAVISIDPEGKFDWQHIYKLNTPGVITACDSVIIASVSGRESESIFYVFDAKGKLITNLSSIVSKPETITEDNIQVFGKSLLGRVRKTEQEFIFLPKYISQIIYYDSTGSVQRAISTISKVNSPELIFDRDYVHNLPGLFPVSEFTTDATLDFFISGNKLITWSGDSISSENGHIFDIYDKNSGYYQYSFLLSLGEISGLDMYKDKLVTYNALTTDITVYRLILEQ